MAGDALERFVYQIYAQGEWDIDDTFYSYRGFVLWTHSRHPDRYGEASSEIVHWSHFNLSPGADPEPQYNPLTLLAVPSSRSFAGVRTDLVLNRRKLRDQWREDGFYLAIPHRWFALVLPQTQEERYAVGDEPMFRVRLRSPRHSGPLPPVFRVQEDATVNTQYEDASNANLCGCSRSTTHREVQCKPLNPASARSSSIFHTRLLNFASIADLTPKIPNACP